MGDMILGSMGITEDEFGNLNSGESISQWDNYNDVGMEFIDVVEEDFYE